jgi:hypothetical protein
MFANEQAVDPSAQEIARAVREAADTAGPSDGDESVMADGEASESEDEGRPRPDDENSPPLGGRTACSEMMRA